MKLKQLLSAIGVDYDGRDVDITSVAQDTRSVKAGSLFVCIKGRRSDGHDFAEKALAAGAVAVVTQQHLGLSCEITVPDTRQALSMLCREYFERPDEQLTLVAVTGTNGKTTVTNLICDVLKYCGHEVGLIGTIQNEIAGMDIPAKFTTPNPFEMFALLSRAVKAGCSHVVMEASSMALEQLRLYGLTFEVGVFTNLTQDHLDYHGTMREYFVAKLALFNQTKCAIINCDDKYGREIIDGFEGECITFSVDRPCDVTAKDVELSSAGVSFALHGHHENFFVPMLGKFSVYNALATIAVCERLGKKLPDISAALKHTNGVKGRCELLYARDFSVICDYAHTGDGLLNFLGSIKPFVKGRLVVLFGCPGERDPKKRPLMAQAVAKYADYVYLTSDNPRDEDAQDIVNTVLKSFEDTQIDIHAHPDRRYSIHKALSDLQQGDVLALCGKGHEDYQVIDGITLYLDEHKIVQEFVKGL